MNISILAAGAAGMYCGSCMRDNGLAATLIRMGHAVTLVPLYTPLRTEQPNAARGEVFFGGVNVYLQHASGVFRKTPRALDWLLDRNWLLKLAGRYGADTPPEQLVGLTLTILQGEEGAAVKELRRLLAFLKETAKPQVVSLPNLMFIGVAPTVRRELGVPVVCELTGEDIFLDAMPESEKEHVRQVIRERVPAVSKFVATCGFYADRMSEYLGVTREKIDVVYPGVPSDYVRDALPTPSHNGHPPTVGYVARICPEKGLHKFLDAVLLLHKMEGMRFMRAKVAGYLGKQHEKWYAEQRQRVQRSDLRGQVEFHGEVDRDTKLKIIDSCDVFSVPTVYQEAKGVPVIEAMARGVPVVQPSHGSFPELLQLTNGGVLVPPDDPQALAKAMHDLLRNLRKRHQLGEAGREAVRQGFTEEHMAGNMLKIYEGLVG